MLSIERRIARSRRSCCSLSRWTLAARVAVMLAGAVEPSWAVGRALKRAVVLGVIGAFSGSRRCTALALDWAGAAGLAAVLAAPERFAGRNVGLILTGGNIDTRLIASVLTRELAREGRLTQIAIDIVDRPGQLAAVSALLAEAGANIIEVSHQRTFSDLPAKGTLLEVVIETRDRAHLDEVMKRLGEAGYTAWLPGRR